MKNQLIIFLLIPVNTVASQSPRANPGCIHTSASELIIEGVRGAIQIGRLDLLGTYLDKPITLSDFQFKSLIDIIESKKDIDRKAFQDLLNKKRLSS